MTYKTKIYKNSSKESDVRIAGNFNDWHPAALIYDPVSKRHQFVVEEKEKKAGKYIFKFVVDGVWSTDQDYPTEFDESGNENNVVLFDNTETNGKDKAYTDVDDTLGYNAVVTPKSTPMDSTPGSTGGLQVNPSGANSCPKTSSLAENSDNSTAAVKIVEPTAAPVSNEASTTSAPPLTKSEGDNVSAPQPVSRPEAPLATETSSNTVPPPEPVVRPTGLEQAKTDENGHEYDENETTFVDSQEVQYESQSSDEQNQVIRNEEGNYGIGFFAAMLHIITQFFNGWFGFN